MGGAMKLAGPETKTVRPATQVDFELTEVHSAFVAA